MYNKEFTPERITELKANEVFVFGSNLAGMHGGGAAALAFRKFGAVWGEGVGLQGRSYAIPTMQGGVETIKPYVDEFIEFAQEHPALKFYVTQIGCGIAGFTVEEMAPLFQAAVDVENIILPKAFVAVLEQKTERRREKSKIATKDSWKTQPMPEKHTTIAMDESITSEAMRVVKCGHIPEAMEDHWFMYCDETTIRYHRSWTGICIYIAKYEDDGATCRISELTVNRDPEQYTNTDDEQDVARFMTLLTKQYGGDASRYQDKAY